MTYACRHCDGQVRTVVMEEVVAACPYCSEEVSTTDAFCGGCGESLKEEETPDEGVSRRVPVVKGRRRSASGARRSGRAGEERRQASHELVKAFGFLKTLRIFFRISIALSVVGVPTTLWMMTWNTVPMGTLLLALAINVGVACVMIVGDRMLFFRPFFWSVMFACLVTLSRANDAYQRDFDIVWVIGGLIWAAAFWAFVPATARARRLLEENPDLHISRLMLGISKRGGGAEDFAEAQEAAERKAWTGSLKWATALVAVSATFAVVFYGKYHRPSFASSWEEFLVDWKGGDVEEVVAWFPERLQERQRTRLTTVKEGRDWGSSWPYPQDPEFLYEPDEEWIEATQVVEASFADGDITWSFGGVDATWKLLHIDLPAPPFDEVEKECVRQWNLSNIPGVAALFRDPERSTRSIEKMGARRDWEGLPRATSVRVQGGGDAREIILDTEEGTVMIRFRLHDDAWVGASIKPPRD
jgi:hypothetical protein